MFTVSPDRLPAPGPAPNIFVEFELAFLVAATPLAVVINESIGKALRDRGPAPHETLRSGDRCPRHQLQGRARRDPRVPGPERRRQDDDDAHPDGIYARH